MGIQQMFLSGGVSEPGWSWYISEGTAYGGTGDNMFDGDTNTYYGPGNTGNNVSKLNIDFDPPISGELKARGAWGEANTTTTGMRVAHSGGSTYQNVSTLGFTSGTWREKVIGTYTNITEVIVEYQHASGGGSGFYTSNWWLDSSELLL